MPDKNRLECEAIFTSKVIQLTCPKCGAALAVEPGSKLLHCQFCGAAFKYEDNTKRTEKYVTIKHTTVDQNRMAELARSERVLASIIRFYKSHYKRWLFFIIAALFIGGVYSVIIDVQSTKYEAQGMVSPGASSASFIGQDYKQVYQKFKDRGFKKVKKLRLGGGLAVWDWGEVVEVTIDGLSGFSAHDYYDPNASVLISYK